MAGAPTGDRLPRALRVILRKDFLRIRREGKPRRDKWMTLWIAPNGRPYCRLGLAVGRHVGDAVTRNRVKRWLREAFRTRRASLPGGVDLLATPNPPAAHAGLDAIAEALQRLAVPGPGRAARPSPGTGAPPA